MFHVVWLHKTDGYLWQNLQLVGHITQMSSHLKVASLNLISDNFSIFVLGAPKWCSGLMHCITTDAGLIPGSPIGHAHNWSSVVVRVRAWPA
jgi:hypothetical protein